MTKLSSMLRQGLLALVLAGTTFGALAGPLAFHVDLTSAGLQGATVLDFQFIGDAATAMAGAKVTNLTGAGPFLVNGGVSSYHPVDGSFTISDDLADFNFVDFSASFLGPISFDIVFGNGFRTGDPEVAGSFSVSALDDQFNPVLNGAGIVVFDLFPRGIEASLLPGAGTVIPVPEPSALLMMMTGLGMVGFTVRRRKTPTA